MPKTVEDRGNGGLALPAVHHIDVVGTTRARKMWWSGNWSVNLKLPPLGIPLAFRRRRMSKIQLCEDLHSLYSKPGEM